jgi:hypothetical protein
MPSNNSVKVKYPKDYGPDQTGITVGKDENGVYIEINWRPPPPKDRRNAPPPPLRIHPKRGKVTVGPADPQAGWRITCGSRSNKRTWIRITILNNCRVELRYYILEGGRWQEYRSRISSASDTASQRQKAKLKRWLKKVHRASLRSTGSKSVRTASFYAKLTAPGEITANVTFGEPVGLLDSEEFLLFGDDEEPGEFDIEEGDDLDVEVPAVEENRVIAEADGEEEPRDDEEESGDPILR